MNVQSTDVVNVSAGIELDTAAATLALAFDADPFMRWMYDDPLNYLENIPALFRAIGQESVEEGAAQRTADGAGVAFWLPPGVAGASEPIQAVISRSVALDKQSDIGAAMEQTEHYRPGSRTGICRHWVWTQPIATRAAARCCSSTGCEPVMSNTCRLTCGRPARRIFRFMSATAFRSPVPCRKGRRQRSSPCCVRPVRTTKIVGASQLAPAHCRQT